MCAGRYGCPGGLAGEITRNIMMLGLGAGATIDCAHTGAGFRIEAVDQAVVSGFHFVNVVGSYAGSEVVGTYYGSDVIARYAGGISARDTRNISILSSTFKNCQGDVAGAISIIHKDGNSNNIHSLSHIQISNSSGGTNTHSGGAAGSISLSYYSHSSGNNNNIHSLSHIQISNSIGGTNTGDGGAAGSISLSYFTGGTAEAQSIFSGSVGLGNNNNTHSLFHIQISNSTGGTDGEIGNAGAISIAYHEQAKDRQGSVGHNNNQNIRKLSVDGCRGGDSAHGAGALAVQLHGAASAEVLIEDSVFIRNQGLFHQLLLLRHLVLLLMLLLHSRL